MDVFTTRPIEKISKSRFECIKSGKEIVVSPHALDHLSERQRKVFKDSDLINMVERESARVVYLQQNGRYSAHFRRSDGYRRLVLEVEDEKITIVTFTDPPELPKLRLQNE
jgi:mRNA-degrading endonuclease RelE of RelBE toxin-antitoxin system